MGAEGASNTQANRISLAPISRLWCDIICHLPHRYLHVSRGLLSDKANSLSSLKSWLMIIWDSSHSPQFCFISQYGQAPESGHLSRIGSQTPSLFTRGIIQHMAAACLWCRIAHKEWFRCLLGEMVTNWCWGLSAIKGQSTYWNEAHFSESWQRWVFFMRRPIGTACYSWKRRNMKKILRPTCLLA